MATITDSILLTVKKMLGIAEEYAAFDIDLIVDINSVFLTLNQLGVGPADPYRINGSEETWSDFLQDPREKLAGVETYVYLKTRLLFDPPTNSFLVDAIKKQCDELEWRLNVQVERGDNDGNVFYGPNDISREPDNKPGDDKFELSSIRSREIELLRASWRSGNEMGSKKVSK